jgi:predicted DNA-binding protein
MASDEIKRVTFKLPLSEYERLEAYCKKAHRGKTEILREFIRSLPDPESESESEKKHKKK